MGKLDEQLDSLVGKMGTGSGFGCPDTKENYEREIDLLKFKITRRDNMKIAVTSALLGAVVASVVTLLSQLFS